MCILDQVKYIIRFDTWPKIEDGTFVTVTATASAYGHNLSDFVDALHLDELNIGHSLESMSIKYMKNVSDVQQCLFQKLHLNLICRSPEKHKLVKD